jgi:hypothetical protein
MRKLFWGLAAVAAVAVGGIFWMMCQGLGWPGGFSATTVVEHCRHVPAAMLGTATSGILRPRDGVADIAGDEDLAAFEKPDDPVEMAGITDPAPEHPTTEVIEINPTPVVPAINIHEPIDVSKPVAVAESGSWSGEATTRPGFEIDPAILQVNGMAIGAAQHEILSVPRVMPYCDDDEVVPPKMPYATDDVPDPDEDDDCEDGGPPNIWSWFFPWLGKHTSLKPPLCGQEESELQPPAPKKLDLESLQLQLQNLMGGSGCGPVFPHIDTMEFRPSDHSRYEHLPNPI